MVRSLENLVSFIFKVRLYVFEVADSKSDVKMTKFTVGSCQLAVEFKKKYKKLKIMIWPYVFEVIELLQSDVKMTKMIVNI